MQRLRELDGLRAIAALSVLAAHLNVDPFKGTEVEAFVHWTHKCSVANAPAEPVVLVARGS